ncbi:MAG: hypothetical protein Q8T13_17195 [Acidobacteriota bacterium]|nr:hypothetical protein [Acidobacteriota bacterium]
MVRGSSFGLAFLLVLASRVFNVPLPGHLAASAAIADDGSLHAVDGLALKINSIVGILPRVTTLIVAAPQEEEARRLSAGRLEIIGASSASHTLEVVFGERLVELLLAEGTTAPRRQQLAEWFFRFSLVGRGELVDWSPVAAAAARALDSWQHLTEDQKFKLGFARGVAERHELNSGSIPVPSVDWLLTRPAPLRTHIVSHLVQQVADVGQPTWSEVEPLVGLVRAANVRDGQVMQLRVEGAIARLWAVTGRAADALARQEELACAYFDSLLYDEVSFPLAEWFRLSGALGDCESFYRAEVLRSAVEAVGGLGLDGSAYVELSHARAWCLLRTVGREIGLQRLSLMAQGHSAPQHVKWAAARCVLRSDRVEADEALSSTIRAALTHAAADPDRRRRHSAAVNLVLVELDEAIAANSTSGATASINRISALEPGLMQHLRLGAIGKDLATHVALCYPY